MASNTSKTRVPLILGTMTLGQEGTNGVRITDHQQCQQFINAFKAHGHNELECAPPPLPWLLQARLQADHAGRPNVAPLACIALAVRFDPSVPSRNERNQRS